MSEDDDDEEEDQMGLDSLRPLLPTETERDLMQRLRKDLKIQLKQASLISLISKINSCMSHYIIINS